MGANGMQGSSCVTGCDYSPGGLGANNWQSATSIPSAAGAAGAASTDTVNGGNAGLVILTYFDSTGSCPL